MSQNSTEQLRAQLAATFDPVAELYDRYRQSYPPSIVESIVHAAQLTKSSRALEIGCGTGQFTALLLPYGFSIVAIDRGPELAEIARRKFEHAAHVGVRLVRFEDFESLAAFDAIFCAQAFHWLDPSTAFARCSSLLKPKGWLSLVWNCDESKDTDFWLRTKSIYDKYHSDRSGGTSVREKIASIESNLRDSKYFEDVVSLSDRWEHTYSKSDYLGLIQTYSDYNSLAPDRQSGFLTDLSHAIDESGGSVTRRYETVAFVARRQ